jgi:hypothetical protein
MGCWCKALLVFEHEFALENAIILDSSIVGVEINTRGSNNNLSSVHFLTDDSMNCVTTLKANPAVPALLCIHRATQRDAPAVLPERTRQLVLLVARH